MRRLGSTVSRTYRQKARWDRNVGLVEVYGDLFQDLAALQNIELLPWGWYGLATDKSGMGETALIDRLAKISSSADAQALEELRSMIAEDSRLRPPGDAALKAIISAERAVALNA
jgi:hypothetical protein